MAVLILLGGKSGGDGFLVAPLGSTYESELSLATDAGTLSVTLQAAPNPAGLVFSNAGPIALTTTPTIVTVHSTLQSNARGDTTIQVLDGAVVVASYTLTSIRDPVINFNGRFETRFATDGLFPNANPMYTAAIDTLAGGWTWGLEGEPDFVPGGTVPTTLTQTGVGRVIRLNNPVALRPLGHDSTGAVNPTGTVPAVVSTVTSITGKVAVAPVDQTFTAGDPLIGQPVNFGPHTYFAGNNENNGFPGLPGVEEVWGNAREPLALFEIRLGAAFTPPDLYFRGASNVSGFVANATALNQKTRVIDSRPMTPGFPLPSAVAEFNELGLDDVPTFNRKRVDALVHDYQALAPGASPQRRNLVRRIAHLLGALADSNPLDPRIAEVKALAVPPDDFTERAGSLNLGKSKEQFTGTVDADLHAWPGGPPGASGVIDYLRQFFAFNFKWNAFAFHSDELCGYHTGTLKGDLTMTGNSIGDPHTRTVSGTNYDFQAVGEFTLLRDGAAMEIQVRQSPVATANPITDPYSDLTVCVSLITAVAARIGQHKISYQPGREGRRLDFYLDGKRAALTAEGIDLGGSRVTAFDANGEIGLRVDYDNGTVLTVTPRFWTAHQAWYMDVGVSNTPAVEGLMGYVPQDGWLPRLRNGQSLGPKPAGLPDRYSMLYKTFADSWRITAATSLFVYASGTSTKTFTDRAWPAAKPPCKLLPQFEIPGVGVHRSIPVAEAEAICQGIQDKDLFQHCVFDVATTGDKFFAAGYHHAQELRLYGTKVDIAGTVPADFRPDRSLAAAKVVRSRGAEHSLVVTATVSALEPGRPTPTGTVTFYIDGVPMRRPVELHPDGSVRVTLGPMTPGEHKIRASYSGGGRYNFESSTSPNLVHVVEKAPEGRPPGQGRAPLSPEV